MTTEDYKKAADKLTNFVIWSRIQRGRRGTISLIESMKQISIVFKSLGATMKEATEAMMKLARV